MSADCNQHSLLERFIALCKFVSNVVSLMYSHTNLFAFIPNMHNHIDEFRSKVACENDVIQLMCNPYSRIAIYGATYGKTGDESLQCQQPSQTSKDDSELR